MIAALESELIRLGRPRPLALAGTVAALIAAITTWVFIAAAPNARPGAGTPTIADLTGAGGATASITAAAGFASILLAVVFVAVIAGDQARGTFRAALLQQPGRLRLLAGKVVALLGLTAALVVAATVVSVVVAVIVAPSEGISTAGWFSLDGLADAALDVGRIVVYVSGWALLATLVAVLTRSVPIGLAIVVAWAGPIERAIGDHLDFAPRWFPGLLLENVLGTDSGAVSGTRAAVTLTAYALIAIVAIVVVIRRRDAT